MSTAESERASSSPASDPDVPACPLTRPRPAFMWPGLQWAVALATLPAPCAYAVWALGLSEGGVASLILGGYGVFMAYLTIDAFDPGALPGPSRPSLGLGIVLKVLALTHAVMALKSAFHMFGPEEFRTQFVNMPDALKLAVLAWLWIVVALAYLCGDAHMRAARRR